MKINIPCTSRQEEVGDESEHGWTPFQAETLEGIKIVQMVHSLMSHLQSHCHGKRDPGQSRSRVRRFYWV